MTTMWLEHDPDVMKKEAVLSRPHRTTGNDKKYTLFNLMSPKGMRLHVLAATWLFIVELVTVKMRREKHSCHKFPKHRFRSQSCFCCGFHLDQALASLHCSNNTENIRISESWEEGRVYLAQYIPIRAQIRQWPASGGSVTQVLLWIEPVC